MEFLKYRPLTPSPPSTMATIQICLNYFAIILYFDVFLMQFVGVSYRVFGETTSKIEGVSEVSMYLYVIQVASVTDVGVEKLKFMLHIFSVKLRVYLFEILIVANSIWNKI